MLTKRFSKLFIAAVVIVAALLTASFAALSASTPSTHASDRSYDAVEQVRSERSAAGNVAADHSYDLVESLRVNRAADATAVDRGYDQIEQLRLGRLINAPIADRSYDLIEKLHALQMYQQ